jgi:hypothetical protein
MDEEFKTEVLTRLTKIETKLDDYKSIREKADVAYNKCEQNSKEIDELKEKNKWLARTVAGAIIVGIITMYFSLVKIGV